MKLKQISIVTLKEKTLELEHNQDKYSFCFVFSIFKYLKFLSMLSMFPLYIYFSFFNISFFLRGHNGNKPVQFSCAIPVAIDYLFFIILYLYCRFFLVYLHDNEINLPTYLRPVILLTNKEGNWKWCFTLLDIVWLWGQKLVFKPGKSGWLWQWWWNHELYTIA